MSDRHALPPYSLRMPQELREQLDSAAKVNRRSLNAEIVARLEKSFATHKEVPADAPLVVVEERGPSIDGSWLRTKRTTVLPSPNQLMDAMEETRRQMEQLQAQLHDALKRQNELMHEVLKKE